jgi:hypothetical protein
LDKIRIGLWLGFRYLYCDPLGIKPHYYIGQRIGVRDRLTAIFKTDNNTKGLTFGGHNTPSFWYTPSCFFIRINSYWFLNISYNDILSRRLGFPYMSDVKMGQEGRLEYKLNCGRFYILVPLLKKWFTLKGTEIYQPIFIGHVQDKEMKEYYNSEYIQEKCLDFDNGIGKVFIRAIGDSIIEYPITPSKSWIPDEIYPFQSFLYSISQLTLEWQNNISNQHVKLTTNDKNEQRKFNTNIKNAILFNKKIIEIDIERKKYIEKLE